MANGWEVVSKYKAPVAVIIGVVISMMAYLLWPESYRSCLEKAAKSANGSGYIYKSLSDLCAELIPEKNKIDKFLDGK